MNKRGRPSAPPAIWSSGGVEPLPGIPLRKQLDSLVQPGARLPQPPRADPLPSEVHVGDAAALTAEAVVEAVRQPLHTTAVHLVAERASALKHPDDVDRMLDALRLERQASRLRLAELGRWLCEFGVTSPQVATGIAILGASGRSKDQRVIKHLGLLQSLTPYSVTALAMLLGEPEDAIFDLAKQLQGSGRIHAVRSLRRTANPVIRDWLLRGGYSGGLPEVAFIAVTAGGLVEALQGEVDEALLDHAGVLLEALAIGGASEDMSHYRSGELAISLYLGHVATAAPTPERSRHLCALDRYLANDAGQNPYFSEASRRKLRDEIGSILAVGSINEGQ